MNHFSFLFQRPQGDPSACQKSTGLLDFFALYTKTGKGEMYV